MATTNILKHLSTMGLTITADGERLKVTPREMITDEARSLIRAHRDELLALLVPPANDPPDITTLANGIAKEFDSTPVQALEPLDHDDKAVIHVGGQPSIDAWRGEWSRNPAPLAVIANTSQGRYSVDMAMADGLPPPVKAITEALPKATVVRFKLKNGEGGGALIDPDGRESAHRELARRYGDRIQEMNP